MNIKLLTLRAKLLLLLNQPIPVTPWLATDPTWPV